MQRVGWIRIGALGDLLVGLASLRETIDMWPSAKVTVIGSPLWLEILEAGHWPQIDRLAIVEKRGSQARIFIIEGGKWIEQQYSISTLRREFERDYDIVVNARVDSPRQGFAAFWAGVPERWGSASGVANFIYNRRAPHDGKDPLIHERDVPLLMMDEAEANIRGDRRFVGKKLAERIEISDRIRKWRREGLPSPKRIDRSAVKEKLGCERYFVVNPTSSRREKAWPTKKFRDVLTTAMARPEFQGLEPIVVGSRSETQWLQEVAGNQFRIVQPESIGHLFDMISGAEFLLANTSSVQFIAACVGTRALTLMGRARPEIWGPLGLRDKFILGQENSSIESIFERERLAYDSIQPDVVLELLSIFATNSPTNLHADFDSH